MYNKGELNEYQQELTFMKKNDFFEMDHKNKQNY